VKKGKQQEERRRKNRHQWLDRKMRKRTANDF
jgi:hypothetical protein